MFTAVVMFGVGRCFLVAHINQFLRTPTGQLESVINPLSSPCVSTDSPEACRNKQGLQWGAEGVRSYAQVLKNAAKELERAAALATDELQDESPYLTE